MSDSKTIAMNISRKHAVLSFSPELGRVTLVDSRSAGGVFINWRRCAPEVAQTLATGDVLAFGGGGCVPIGSIKAFQTEFRYVVEKFEDDGGASTPRKRVAPAVASAAAPAERPKKKARKSAKASPLGQATSKAKQTSMLFFLKAKKTNGGGA